MKRSSLLLACVLPMLAAGTAWSDSLEPTWKGAAGSTFQEWVFSSDANPAAPDTDNNSYGTATAEITVGMFGGGWLDDLGFGTQSGYWDLGSAGEIVLDIPNRPQPLPYKEIWIQVAYYTGPLSIPQVSVPGAAFIGSQDSLIENDILGQWRLYQSLWRIEPNPSSEQIIVTAPWNGSLIDRIAVDTICAPEPCSALMLGLAALLLRKRRA